MREMKTGSERQKDTHGKSVRARVSGWYENQYKIR